MVGSVGLHGDVLGTRWGVLDYMVGCWVTPISDCVTRLGVDYMVGVVLHGGECWVTYNNKCFI